MIHPDTELRYINEVFGYGVFATAFIPKGTITWALDDLDQILEHSFVSSLDDFRKPEVLKYSYRDRFGRYVLCWDNGKYVNHDFNANCIATAYEIELAGRDIYPGEELTDDYRTLNMDEPFHCLRGGNVQDNVVWPDDLTRIHEQLDQQAQEAFAQFNKVKQPLQFLIKKEYAEKIEKIVKQGEELDSILTTYFDRDRTHHHRSISK